MKQGQKVTVLNQSVGEFVAFVREDNSLYETVDVVIEESDVDKEDVATMTFSYSDIKVSK